MGQKESKTSLAPACLTMRRLVQRLNQSPYSPEGDLPLLPIQYYTTTVKNMLPYYTNEAQGGQMARSPLAKIITDNFYRLNTRFVRINDSFGHFFADRCWLCPYEPLIRTIYADQPLLLSVWTTCAQFRKVFEYGARAYATVQLMSTEKP